MFSDLPPTPRKRTQSVWKVFFQPLQVVGEFILRRLSWWIGLLGLLYLGSGITIIQPDEVGVVYRWGNVRNMGSAQETVQPGMLWALPKPMDRVERIPVQKVFQLSIDGLHFRSVGQMTFLQSSTLDPEKVGYVLTGDGNVVHVSFGLNYQISDPVLFSTQVVNVEDSLDHVVRSIALSSMASRTVDTILSDGREALLKEISTAVQSRLDNLALGVTVVSLEIQDLVPPYQVKDEFNAVQTASIEAKTKKQEAEEYRAQQIPRAETNYKKEVSKANAESQKLLATARAESKIFEQLALEAQRNSTVVRRRLLQERLENIGKSAGEVRFVPPPVGSKYPEGFRILLDGEP